MDLLKSIFKGDRVIWIIFLFLCIISIVEVFSASSTLIYRSGNHWAPITQHCIYLLVGAFMVILFHIIPYKNFIKLYPFLLFASAFFLVLLLLFDHLNAGGFIVIEQVNDAGRWVKVLGIQFQPSELAKMAVVIYTALILSKKKSEEELRLKDILYKLAIPLLFCALILPENYSTAFLLLITIYLMMIIGGIPFKKLLLLGGGFVLIIVLAISFLLKTTNETLEKIPMGHRLLTVKARILEFSKDEEIPAAKFDIDKNGQVAHARIAVATSHVVGKGPGNSVQRDFLSQAYSDFIYAIIIEELGLVGGILVVFLYICLLIRVGRIAKKCDRAFPAFLVLGIGVLLVVQALFNMMVAVGLAPITGQPLPLISRGGTSMIINCIYIGMILSVSRYASRLEEQRQHDASIPMQVVVPHSDESLPYTDGDAPNEAGVTDDILTTDDEFV